MSCFGGGPFSGNYFFGRGGRAVCSSGGRSSLEWKVRLGGRQNGSESKLTHQTASFSPWFHLPFPFWVPIVHPPPNQTLGGSFRPSPSLETKAEAEGPNSRLHVQPSPVQGPHKLSLSVA